MREFLVILTPAQERFKSEPTEAEMRSVQGHFAHFSRALEQGMLLLAGRTDGKEHGIGILRCADLDSAHAFLNADPAVANGVFRAEIYPFSIALGRIAEPEAPK